MWVKKTVAAILIVSEKQKSVFNVIQEFDSTGYVDEILVVDKIGRQKIKKESEKTRAKYVASIKSSINSTKADLLVFSNADGSFQGKDILKLLSYSDDFSTVFGSRTHIPLIQKGSGMNFARRLVDDIFGKMISVLFLSSNLTDVGCVFRLTDRKGWRKVAKDCKSDTEMFFTQWLVAAARRRVRFIEVPVNFQASEIKTDKLEEFFYQVKRGTIIFFYIWKTWISDQLSR